jgi:hypothetical protein
VNVSGTWTYAIINQRAGSTTYSLVNASTASGSCYYTNIANFIFSTSHLTSSTPEAFVAAFPGRIHVLYSSNEDGSSPNFVFVGSSNGTLGGSYSVSSTFDQSTRNVSVTVSSITFTGIDGSKTPNDATYGISSDRRLVLGVCTDTNGDDCSDGSVLSSSTMPVTLSTGLSSGDVNDQHTYTRYAVVNGLGYSFNIGANLGASISSSDSSPADGDMINLTATVSNSGNVNISSAFNVSIYDNGVLFNRTKITSTITPGNHVTFIVPYDTTAKTGSHTFKVSADSDNNIVETSKADNNGTTVVDVQKTYSLKLYIDGVQSTTFSEAGRPYNVTVNVTDSLGAQVDNATVRIIEENGLSLLAPIQVWQEGGQNKSVKSYSIVEVRTNSSGLVSFTLIPTGNKLIDVYPNITAYTGNYSLSAQLYVGGTLEKTKALTLTNLTAGTPDVRIAPMNKANIDYIYDVIYQIFSNIKNWFTY